MDISTIIRVVISSAVIIFAIWRMIMSFLNSTGK